MSHPRRRPSVYSRGSSPRIERSLSVTEANFQSLGLHETAGAQHLSVPSSSYGLPSSHHRRPSYPRGQPDSNFFQPQYDSYPPSSSPTSFSSLQPAPTIVPPDLVHPDFASFPETTSFTGRTETFSTNSPNMRYHIASHSPMSTVNEVASSYPYSSASAGGVYSGSSHYSSRSPSQRYPNPNTEASLSRSMFGSPGPNILPSSTFGEFRDAEREGARQRRRNNRQSRREGKMRLRRTMLPSIPDAVEVQADVASDLIDYSIAHSHSPYGSHSSYGRASTSTANDPYIANVHRSPYDSYNDYPGSSVGPGYGSSSQPRLASSHSVTYPVYSERGGSHAGSTAGDPVVIETPKKPQCWEHGCNGRQFSTFSNLLRHQREKSGNSTKSVCHRCGAEFTRKTARDGHLAHDKCKPRGSSER